MRMRKLMMLPGIALGALALGVAGGSAPASAASNLHAGVAPSHASPMNALEDDGDDDDEDDDDGEDTTVGSNGGVGANTASGSGSGAGSGGLAATGANASTMAMLGAVALAAGGAMHQVSRRRAALAQSAEVTR